MIQRVVSHQWRRKGYSSLVIELHQQHDDNEGTDDGNDVKTIIRHSGTEDHERERRKPKSVRLRLCGATEETTPYLVSVVALSSLHPDLSTATKSSTEECDNDDDGEVLIEGRALTSLTTDLFFTLHPSHKFLRIDMVGKLHRPLLKLWDDGDVASRAAISSVAFDQVNHELTVSLDAASSVLPKVLTPPRPRSLVHSTQTEEGVSDKRLRISPLRRTSVLSSDTISIKKQHLIEEDTRIAAGTNSSHEVDSSTSLYVTLRNEAQALNHQYAELQEQIAWYEEEDRGWERQKAALLLELRGGPLTSPPRLSNE